MWASAQLVVFFPSPVCWPTWCFPSRINKPWCDAFCALMSRHAEAPEDRSLTDKALLPSPGLLVSRSQSPLSPGRFPVAHPWRPRCWPERSASDGEAELAWRNTPWRSCYWENDHAGKTGKIRVTGSIFKYAPDLIYIRMNCLCFYLKQLCSQSFPLLMIILHIFNSIQTITRWSHIPACLSLAATKNSSIHLSFIIFNVQSIISTLQNPPWISQLFCQ